MTPASAETDPRVKEMQETLAALRSGDPGALPEGTVIETGVTTFTVSTSGEIVVTGRD